MSTGMMSGRCEGWKWSNELTFPSELRGTGKLGKVTLASFTSPGISWAASSSSSYSSARLRSRSGVGKRSDSSPEIGVVDLLRVNKSVCVKTVTDDSIPTYRLAHLPHPVHFQTSHSSLGHCHRLQRPNRVHGANRHLRPGLTLLQVQYFDAKVLGIEVL